MSITSQLSAHGSGFRARFVITLADGRVIHRGPIPVANQAAADAKAITLEADVIVATSKSDAEEAVSQGIITAYKTASINQISYATLQTAYMETEYYRAYALMKDVAPDLMALGYTNEQYASAFNSTVEDVANIKAFWVILDANSAVLQSYNDFIGSI